MEEGPTPIITFLGTQKYKIGYWGRKFYLAAIAVGIPARPRYLHRMHRRASDATAWGKRFIETYRRFARDS